MKSPNKTWPLPTKLKSAIYRAVRSAAFSAPAPLQRSFSVHRYPYMFTPAQLAFFCQCLDETGKLDGNLLEIGCAYGHTTVFLNRHLDSRPDDRRQYVCVDTFGSFTSEDIEYEVSSRGKAQGSLDSWFNLIRYDWFEKTMRNNRISRVTTYQSDVSKFDFSGINSISFCLLDVDLYLPTLQGLHRVYDLAQAGAIILVDDCAPNNDIDGAYQAFNEFIEDKGIEGSIVLDKLGVIKKR